MKAFALATILIALTSAHSNAAIDANLNPLLEHVPRIAFGAAAGYVAKNRYNAYADDASVSTLNVVPNASIAAAALTAAYLALGGKYWTECFYVGSLAAILTFLVTQNAQAQVDAGVIVDQSAGEA